MGLQPLSGWRPTSLRAPICPVVESIRLTVAAGFEHKRAYLSFQEYFERLRTEAERWGKLYGSRPGAPSVAQVDLGAGAIGGKDSMSGSFEDEAGELNVPPTRSTSPSPWARPPAPSLARVQGLTHRVAPHRPRHLWRGTTARRSAAARRV